MLDNLLDIVGGGFLRHALFKFGRRFMRIELELLSLFDKFLSMQPR